MSDYDDEWEELHNRPFCENCNQPMKNDRSCERCGQRICKSCALHHDRGNNSDPGELWFPCLPEELK